MKWLPNAITSTRLAAIPVLLLVLARADGTTSLTAGFIFTAVGLTDFLDGILARRLGAESRFGRIADPLADRLLIAVGLVGILLLDRLHPAGPSFLLARDVLLIAGFVVLLRRRGVEMRVDLAGKITSGVTMFAVGAAIFLDRLWVDIVFWIAVAMAAATLLNYVRLAVTRPGDRPAPSTRP